MTSSTWKKLFAVAGAILLTSNSQSAENSTPAANSERCIQTKDIRQTEVVDDQNILFHLRNNKVYKNHLPHRCGGLAMADAFLYETRQSQLCNVDIIKVLNSTAGTLMPGASCGLGVFEPVEPVAKADKK